ncbi:MAG: hypothetical protein ABIF06_00170 [bacterium]
MLYKKWKIAVLGGLLFLIVGAAVTRATLRDDETLPQSVRQCSRNTLDDMVDYPLISTFGKMIIAPDHGSTTIASLFSVYRIEIARYRVECDRSVDLIWHR